MGVVGWIKDAYYAYLNYTMQHGILQSWGMKKRPKKFNTMFKDLPGLKQSSVQDQLKRMRGRYDWDESERSQQAKSITLLDHRGSPMGSKD